MARGIPPRRDPREQKQGRKTPSQRRVPRPATRGPESRQPIKKEPMRLILNSEPGTAAPTQMLRKDRKVTGKPAPPSPSPPPGRIPLTKEQVMVGKVLLAEGPITSDLVRREIEDAGLQNSLLAKAVAASGHAPESELITLLLTGYRIPKVKLANYRIPQEALKLIPGTLARKYSVVPLGKVGSIVCVAVGSIFGIDISVVQEIRAETGCLVKLFQASTVDVEAAVKRFYPAPKKRDIVAATPVAPDVVESVSSESLPYEDTADYWEEMYTSAGPLKAIKIED